MPINEYEKSFISTALNDVATHHSIHV